MTTAFSVPKLVLVPGLVALAVTLLRLTGELMAWPRPLANLAPCGKAILGVVWLVPIVGVYFAVRLRALEPPPARLIPLFLYAAAGLALKLAGTAVMEMHAGYAPRLLGNTGLTLAGLVVSALAWPRLFQLLLAYGYASRLPVAAVTFLAMRGHWGTHYDALEPGFPAIGFWPTFLRTSFVPNIFFMEAYTVIVGLLFAVLWLALARAWPKLARSPISGTITPEKSSTGTH